jgi:hypothetical protein
VGDEQRGKMAAYYIWEKDGKVHGRDKVHWGLAVAELRQRKAAVQFIADDVQTVPAAARWFLNIDVRRRVITKQSDVGRGCRPGGTCTTSAETC